MPPYSIVIATLDRPRRLHDTLASIAAQTHLPEQIIIVDASSDEASLQVANAFETTLPITYQKAREHSAAKQRNQGAEGINSPLIAFTDDDVVLAPDLFQLLSTVFDQRPDTGAVAARMHGFGHHRPRGLLRLYYRIQAGYNHPTWGAKLFGPGINCLPCYEEDAIADELVPAEWLPSTAILVSAQAFVQAGRFPDWQGYSFMEDAWLTASIRRSHPLYFHSSAWFEHFPSINSAKSNAVRLGKMRIQNRRKIAVEFLDLRGMPLTMKLFLHRLFTTIALLRQRPSGFMGEIIGTWQL